MKKLKACLEMWQAKSPGFDIDHIYYREALIEVFGTVVYELETDEGIADLSFIKTLWKSTEKILNKCEDDDIDKFSKHLQILKAINEFEYRYLPGLRKRMPQRLSRGKWILLPNLPRKKSLTRYTRRYRAMCRSLKSVSRGWVE